MRNIQLCIFGCLTLINVLSTKAEEPEPYRSSHAFLVENKTDTISTDDILAIVETRSKIQCADKCVDSMSCFSFFYNKYTKVCQTHGKGLQPESGVFKEGNGFRYYQLSGDPNACISGPCKNGGTCVETASGYTCACVAGYEGIHCETEPGCPRAALDTGYVYEPRFNLCYKLEKTSLKYAQSSKDACVSDGAHLVTITGDDMYQFLLARMTFDAVCERYFIDGSDAMVEGSWKTIIGDPLWTPPRGVEQDGGNAANCVEIWMGQGMHDIDCSDQKGLGGYICQIDI